MLSDNERENVLREFPKIKLAYENIIHKQVYNYNIIMAIPCGIKCFAWFTEYKNQNVCFIMDLNENKKIIKIRITNVCFKSELAYNTILYGTLFHHLNHPFFAFEDVFFYKGNNVSRQNWLEKFHLFNTIVQKDIKQIAYNKNCTIFGIPLLSNNIDDLMNKIKEVHYKINILQFKVYKNGNQFLYMSFQNYLDYLDYEKNKSNNLQHYKVENTKPNQTHHLKPNVNQVQNKNQIQNKNQVQNSNKKTVVFKIKPSLQNDIYDLYCVSDDRSKEIYYDVAYIPSFNSSVMMNRLFRNIKENKNLDKLEESDDEEEFENVKEGRFVNLDTNHNMVCMYNHKFKKWIPLCVADNKTNIVNHGNLSKIV